MIAPSAPFSSFSNLNSFLHTQRSIQLQSQGDPLTLSILSFCSSCSFLVFCPMSFNHFCLSGLAGLFPELKDISGLCCSAPFLRCNLESLSRHQLGQSQASTHLFSYSQGSLPCTVWCPVSGNCWYISNIYVKYTHTYTHTYSDLFNFSQVRR